MRRITRVLVAAAALACVLVTSARPARPDAEETEYRLKTAGVPEALRLRIHAAIRKASDFLARRQRPDGSFALPAVQQPGLAGFGTSDVPGYTALCSLALAHAGTTSSRDAAARGIANLLPGTDRVKADVYQSTYTAGLTAMLLRAMRREPAVGLEIARRFAKGVGRTNAGWGYVPAVPDSTLNLSTAQFGALGMWAGDPALQVVDRAAWRGHLEMLVDRQAKDGAWSYTLARAGKDRLPRGVGYDARPFYPSGAFMGLANLVLARAGAGTTVYEVPGFVDRCDAALDLALGALDREGPRLLEILRGERTTDPCGYFPMYDLYALEKACVFTGREHVGGRAWYVTGAEWLVDVQEADGGFGTANCEPELVRTSFALLFLLRGSEVYRVDTPRDVDAPPATTGVPAPRPSPPGAPAAAPDGPRPARPAFPLSLARQLLEDLDAMLADRGASDAVLAATIGLVDDAYAALAPDTPAADAAAWRGAAEKLLLRALALDDRSRGQGAAGPRTAVHVRAAAALGRTDARVAAEMRRILERVWLAPRRADVSREAWAAAFDALAALGGAESAAWLCETVLTMAAGTVPDEAQTAALEALRRFAPLPGRLRRDIALRVVTLYASMESHAQDPALTLEARAAAMERWGRLSGPAVRLVRHLAEDPATGAIPGWSPAMWSWKLADFRRWLDDHEDVARSPWKT